jgi:glycosyltransferase involved in cell wall biosynthesis
MVKRKLKIAQLVPPWIPVPPNKYGGTELIASHLSEGLISKGHKVTLFASGDSKTKAELISVFPKALYQKKVSWNDAYSPLLQIMSCAEKLKDFDIIHNHFHYWGLFLSFLTKTKTITTYHGDFNSVPLNTAKYKLLEKFKTLNFVSISNSQKKIKGIKINFIATVYNGIDVSKFKFSEKPGKYLAWLGRITPKKGVLESINIARKAGMNLKIAAKIDQNVPEDVAFYNQKVKPFIDGKKISYIGEIGGHKEKSDFLTNSFALLNPIKWQEPFGLNMVEAMACGTPVIAFKRGSVPEIIKDKKTGFIVNNIDQAVKAVKKIDQVNRKECRKRVEENFTKEKMIDKYEEIYYKILN